ncbi:MAG: amidohydrolase family protein [Litorilinea sp.]
MLETPSVATVQPPAHPAEQPIAAAASRQRTAIIDCDIHNALPSEKTLHKYLSARWRRHLETVGMRGPYGSAYPRLYPNAARHDAWPPSGLPPGADLDFLRAQLLDGWQIDYGILNCLFGVGGQLNLEFGAALAQAMNDWQVAEWVEPEPRLRASLLVPYEDGELAAAEIDRMGSHPAFAQVLLIARTAQPLGARKYWKLYEAAARHNLPIGIHFGGGGGGPITGSGWPSFYIEDHGGMPQAFQAQIISLVYAGVFDHFPTLKFVLIEGGFAWLPPLMWRMDALWQTLGAEVPHLTQPPSSYIRKHFWLTTQPIEEPPQRAYFDQLLDHLNMNDRLMFATDYPHWDFDAPDRAIPPHLDHRLRRAIMADNAAVLYGLDIGDQEIGSAPENGSA